MHQFTPIRLLLIALLSLTLAPMVRAGVQDVRTPELAGAISATEAEEKHLYIVQLSDPPALAVHAALQDEKQRSELATGAGAEFDPDSTVMHRHLARLQAKQNQMLMALNLWNDRVYSYGYTFNGVAVQLTPREAEQLRLRKGVTRVWRDSRRRVATSDSPAFLGLMDADNGLRTGLGLSGENIIIGVIDSGITPNHPSLSERAERKVPGMCRSEWAEKSLLGLWLCRRFNKPGNVIYTETPANWRGVCQTGEGFDSDDCNGKIIGARFYHAGFDLDKGVDSNEFISPADADGHGTHVATIAAGNEVNASIFGKSLGRISGIAPRARLAIYKACWLEPGASRATCSVADLQKAIDDAVNDGVDIINYSIGDLNDSLDDPDDLALLAAAKAGVVSVAATGNGGPTAFTIESPATTPWVISVGATSRAGNRVAEALRVNTPESLAQDYESREAGFTPRLADSGPLTATLVVANDGSTVTADDEIGTIYDGCTKLVNAAEMEGNIALIQRGYCDFDVKISLAQNAGAIAAVVYSNDEQLLTMVGDSSLVNIPAVMIGQADGQLIRDKILAEESVEITLDKSLFINFRDAGNLLGSFSGRGPSLGDSDFLKPDVVAPGTSILGGHTPNVANGFRGEKFQYLSGTSQAAPHVAGIAALIKQAHPDWSPAEIKSALMTTGRQNILRHDGVTATDPFDIGAGHIVPNSAIDPGLLYPLDTREYDGYLCTIGLSRMTSDECTALAQDGFAQDARDINLPSVAITELTGKVVLRRQVTNPASEEAHFHIETSVPPGIRLDVEPQNLSLKKGEPGNFTLTFSAEGAALNRWHYGSYSWVNDSHRVYSPFIVQPTQLGVPEELRLSGATGKLELPISFGYTGTYAATVNGLTLPCVLPATVTNGNCVNTGKASVSDDPNDNYIYTDQVQDSVRRFMITVEPTDNRLLRIALYDELTAGNDDLDLYLYYCQERTGQNCLQLDPDLLSSATPATSNEYIDVSNPAAGTGTWILDVHGYDTEGADSAFQVYVWSFGSNIAAGNLLLSSVPAGAVAGTTGQLVADFNLPAEGLWLGGITHYDTAINSDDAPLAFTVIEIDNNTFPAAPD